MSTTDTKRLTERWFEEVWNRKNQAVIHEMMDAAASGLTETGKVVGPDEFLAQVFIPLTRAFPDVKVTIEGLLAEADEVAVRWTATAIHKGEFAGLPASGRPVRFSGMTWLQFRNGKIAGGADRFNAGGLYAYLAGGPPSATVQAGGK